MVLKADQERIRTLLKDTITLLCKNGLTFKSKFSVDALIGVTLDEDDVFLVSIRDVISSEKAVPQQDQSDTSSDDGGSASPGHKRRKRKRKIKQEQAAEHSEEDAHEDDEVEPAVKRLPQVKQEVGDDEDEQEDIVFIKTELDDNWQQQQQQQQHQQHHQDNMYPGMDGSMQQEDQNFSSLSGLDLVPLSQDQGGPPPGQMMWMGNNQQQQQQQQQRPYRPRIPRTSTVTSSPGDPQLQQQQQGGDQSLDASTDQSQIETHEPVTPFVRTISMTQCSICGKHLSSKHAMVDHELRHKQEFKMYCQICNKGFMNRTAKESHELQHLNKKKYSCDLCEKQYVHKKDLMNHMYLHQNLKVHCPNCDRTVTKNSLPKHVKACLGRRFTCPYCPHTTGYKTNLLRHIKSKHKERVTEESELSNP